MTRTTGFVNGFRAGVRERLAALPCYYGWLIVAVCFVYTLLTFGTVYSFGVLFEPIVAEFGRSYSGTSAMFSIQSVATYGSAAFLGFVIDRYGIQRLLATGTALVAGGLTLASVAPTFWTVVGAYGLVSATGFGTMFVISYATPSRWFTRRLGLATAVATSGTGIGIVVVPPVVSALVPRFGWRGAYLALAAAFLVTYVFAWVVLEDRPRDVSAASSGRVDAPASRETVAFRAQFRTVLATGKSVSFAFLFTAILLAFSPAYVLLVHAVEHASSAGIGRSVGVFALSVLGGMNVVGKFVVGPLADRIGIVRTMALCSVCTGAGGASIPLAGDPAAFLALTAVIGVGYGGMGALLSPALAEQFGTLDINALFGLVATSFAITGSVGPYLAGMGFDALGTFDPGFLGAGAAALVAVALFVVVDAV